MAGRVNFRRLRLAAYALFLLLLAFCLIQVQQRILRHRAESLMADVHNLRLHQSDWNEAQALMNRWGAWGHYDGSCTAADCRYSISFYDPSWKLMRSERPAVIYWVQRLHLLRAYNVLGGRSFAMRVEFIVQDGTIWRTGVTALLDVPPRVVEGGEYSYMLIVSARARNTLREDFQGNDGWVLGGNEQLAKHPNYKAGRPGGCSNCLVANVTYTPQTDQSEIRRITTFDFSCLTRFTSCKRIEDLLPAAKEWHLYDWLDYGEENPATRFKTLLKEVAAPDTPVPGLPPQMQPRFLRCDIPLWAIGRDSGHVLIVDALSTEKRHGICSDGEWNNVRVVGELKGHSSAKLGAALRLYRFPGSPDAPEPLVPGKRYVLLVNRPPDGETESLELESCNVFEDTAQVRSELERGATLNDHHMRGPQVNFAGFPWN